MELISIFDSEKQPPGSIIRDRSRPRTPRHISTSAHGDGTPKSSSNQHAAGTGEPSDSQGTIINAGFGAATSLHLESMPDICALLSTYISSLPEPVLPPFLFRALWELCGIEEDEVAKLNSESEAGHHPNASPTSVTSTPMMRAYTSTYASPLASSRILTAQLLLHLLPSPNFSLLVYFLAFFSQAALVREENGVGIEDLAKMFGGKIFGGGLMATGANNVAGAPAPTSTEVDELQFNTAHNARRPSDASSVSNISVSSVPPRRPSITTGVIPTPETRREGEVMMCWFLRRWGPISDGLFEVLSSLGIDDEELSSEDDNALDQPRSKAAGEGVKEKSRRTWSRNPSTSTQSSPSSCYSSSPSSPKATPTLPKFLRRDTFGRIPLPQDWLDRLSSASRPISRSLSLTRSRSRSLSRSLSLSRSRSRSASPPLDPPVMPFNPTNEAEVGESGIVHARPQGRTRFQLGTTESGNTAGRKRAASALPYTDSRSWSSPRKSWTRDGSSRNRERVVEGDERGKSNTEKRSKEPPKHIIIPVPVHADVSVPMSVQMLEEMDIVDDYGTLSCLRSKFVN
ncbi:hypothetical protein BJ165DRAFT_429749 [Panaeolus papilionaceus]|nr:hypothetical protein BJ165DRAFT_429749 [Panaeolus papilionaceus]